MANLVLRLLGWLVGLVLVLRVAAWLASTLFITLVPLDAYHLESKMVYLAREFQRGRPLYPNWTSYPYESNFFGPAYFALVGTLGDITDAGQSPLRTIGRAVTWLSLIAVAALVASLTWRATRNRRASAIAAVALLASAPMIGFGQMARPDLMALAWGVAGYWLYTTRQARTCKGLAILFFALAVLTKQTAFVPAAAIIMWQLARRQWRDAALLTFGWLGVVTLTVLLITLLWEPRCAADLLGERSTTFQLQDGVKLLRRAAILMPDTILATAAILCARLTTRNATPLLVYLFVASAWNALSCFKLGADLNYFLDLSVVGAISVGILWSHSNPRRTCGDGSASAPSGTAQVRSVEVAGQGLSIWGAVAFWAVYLICAAIPLPWAFVDLTNRSSVCQTFRSHSPDSIQYANLERLMQSPEQRVLTDSPYLALESYHQPPFVDPWLFRRLVVSGKIEPKELIARIEARQFDLILSTAQIMEQAYNDYTFGYPPVVAAAIRRHYTYSGWSAGTFLYQPRAE